MIALINLGNSNIQSVINALDFLQIKYTITTTPQEIQKCDKIILPGVGTFGNGIEHLHKLNLFNIIKTEVLFNHKPILGICLGMQMLFNSSQESPGVEGLGLINGEVVSLPLSENYKIPRIGWAESAVNFDFLGLNKNENIDFYFIHSFYVLPNNDEMISISTNTSLTAAIQHKNIYGCQFHPEKSHKHGLKILESFNLLERTI